MIRRAKGFTLVEVVVIIVVIAILATIVTLGLSKYLQDGRDSRRESNTVTISEALEKYYDENGEYPSCVAVTGSASSVSQSVLKGIDQAALVMPNADGGTANSLTCTAITTATRDDVIEYKGDGSQTCQTGGSCLSFTLRYREEGTGNVIEIKSRRAASVASSGVPTISASATGFNSINTSWTAVSNATAYKLEVGASMGFSGLDVIRHTVSTTSLPISGLTSGTQYYVRVAAVLPSGESAWSNIVSVLVPVPVADPTGVVLTATMSGTSAVGTASAACSNGSSQYQFRTRNTNTTTMGAWSGWSAWSSTTSNTLTSTAEGYQYGFQVQARCVSGSSSSNTVSPATIATAVRPFSAPATPSVSASTSGNVTTYTRNSPTCSGNGTTAYQYRRLVDDGSSAPAFTIFTGTAVATTTSTQGYNYTVQWQARCTNTYSTSGWSGAGAANYVRPVSGAARQTYNGYRGAWNIMYLEINSSCGVGGSLYGAADVHTWDFPWNPGGHIGWRRSSLGWAVAEGWRSNYTLTGGTTSNPIGIPSGSRWNVGASYRCQNYTTGRNSGGNIWQESGIFYAS